MQINFECVHTHLQGNADLFGMPLQAPKKYGTNTEHAQFLT